MNRILKVSQRSEERFSREWAFRLCREVEKWEADGFLVATERSSEVLRQLAETLVYCDKHDELTFDSVMEHDLMNTFERIITNAETPRSVVVHVLDCIYITLQNLTRVSSVYLLCSNNHINRIIAVGVDDKADDEFVSTYISFIKTMALRLNADTVQFFFDSDTKAFPLFDHAVKLTDSNDSMVRTAARQIVVSVIQLEDTAVQRFLSDCLEEVFTLVVDSINSHLNEVGKSFPLYQDCTTRSNLPTVLDLRGILTVTENIVDDLYYLNDLCSGPLPCTGQLVLRTVEERFVIPLRIIVEREVERGPFTSESTAGTGGSGGLPLQAVHGSTALAFLARWMGVNDVPQIRQCVEKHFTQVKSVDPLDALFCKHPSATQGSKNLLCRILVSSHVGMHAGAVLLLAVLSTNTKAGSLELPKSVPFSMPESLEQFFFMQTPYQQSGKPGCGGRLSETAAARFPAVATYLQRVGCATDATSDGYIPALLSSLYTQIYQTCHSSPRALYMTVVEIRRRLQNLPNYEQLTEAWYIETMKLAQARLLALMSSYTQAMMHETKPPSEMDSVLSLSRQACWAFTTGLHLQDPYELVFLELKRAWEAASAEQLQDVSRAHDPRDVSFWIPPYPLLPNTHDPTEVRDVLYNQWQRCVADAVPLTRRAAATEEESSRAPYLCWILLRRLFGSLSKLESATRADPCDTAVQNALDCLRTPTVPTTTLEYHRDQPPLWFRCETVAEWRADPSASRSADTVTPGTSLYLTTHISELLIVHPPERNETCDRESALCQRNVAFSMDLCYTRAVMVLEDGFRVALRCLHPGHEVEVHVVFCSRYESHVAVGFINEEADRIRQKGASLCCGLLNFKSALVDRTHVVAATSPHV